MSGQALAARTIKANMARRGLLSNQLGWYENPDTEKLVDPKKDPETIRALWEFRSWLQDFVDGWT